MRSVWTPPWSSLSTRQPWRDRERRREREREGRRGQSNSFARSLAIASHALRLRFERAGYGLSVLVSSFLLVSYFSVVICLRSCTHLPPSSETTRNNPKPLEPLEATRNHAIIASNRRVDPKRGRGCFLPRRPRGSVPGNNLFRFAAFRLDTARGHRCQHANRCDQAHFCLPRRPRGSFPGNRRVDPKRRRGCFLPRRPRGSVPGNKLFRFAAFRLDTARRHRWQHANRCEDATRLISAETALPRERAQW
jgi:hypothetical protein